MGNGMWKVTKMHIIFRWNKREYEYAARQAVSPKYSSDSHYLFTAPPSPEQLSFQTAHDQTRMEYIRRQIWTPSQRPSEIVYFRFSSFYVLSNVRDRTRIKNVGAGGRRRNSSFLPAARAETLCILGRRDSLGSYSFNYAKYAVFSPTMYFNNII